MKFLRQFQAIIFLMLLVCPSCLRAQENVTTTDDPYLWLEEVQGDKALDWVKSHDEATMQAFQNDTNFLSFQKEALKILNADDRIPYGSYRGGYIYNFWQDEEHVRGILRRTTLVEYKKTEPEWETLLDIDKLNQDEGKSWVYAGSYSVPPAYDRCLVMLSDGGRDAVQIRELDYSTRSFVKDGFYLPVAKSGALWLDSNTLIIDTDFGPGSLTESGYPRIVKLWKRGTTLPEAVTLLEGEETDVSASAYVVHRPEGNVMYVSRNVSFWESKRWLVDEKMEKTEIPIPDDAEIETFFKGYMIVRLFSDWLGFQEGSLIALKTSDLSAEDMQSRIELIYAPDEISTIKGVSTSEDYLLVSILNNVKGKLLYFKLPVTGERQWRKGEVRLPEAGSIGVQSTNNFTNIVLVTYEDFLSPTKLYLLQDPESNPEEIKSLPDWFDAANMQVAQYEAKSKDGTIIPYFLVSKKDLSLNSQNPTLLYGYGGFRSSQTPYYSRMQGKFWLEKGGVFALANIRGGGEFGPKWHKAALLENRQKSFDDFIAVAEDLIARKITSPRNLGIMGGSNGGLLVGAVFTQRPELFNAIVCQVPLLDMIRYTKLGAGASWVGEYGDPAIPEQRAFIERYSPYQNLKPGVKYPQALFVTSTLDDRVHPGHARKMAARMEELGNQVYFYEETEGGHGASADNIQRAKRHALEYSYLVRMLFN
ncbi:MAG: prolyl oligopeptidase family serine peptidase [Candidatus Zixiibacteriota bacterium]